MNNAKKLLLVDPSRRTATENKLSKLDSEISTVLNGNMPDDEKAKLHMEALKDYRFYEMPKPIRTDPEEEIIKKLPPIIQPHAKQLLERIHPFVSWNDNGKLVHKQLTVPY